MSYRRRTARAIIMRDGELLVFERWRRNDAGDELHYYSIPGGGIETDETPEIAVQRELMEEMGIVISVDSLLIRQTTDTRYHYYFACSIVSGVPAFQLGSPEAELVAHDNRYTVAWVTLENFDSLPFFPDYQHAVETILRLKGSSDVNTPIDIVFRKMVN